MAVSFFVDGYLHPDRSRGEWKCTACGHINECEDRACVCDEEAERLRLKAREMLLAKYFDISATEA